MLNKILVIMLMWIAMGPIVVYGTAAWCMVNAERGFQICESDERYDKYMKLMTGMNGQESCEFAKSIVGSADGRKTLLIRTITLWPSIVTDILSRHKDAMMAMFKEYGATEVEES